MNNALSSPYPGMRCEGLCHRQQKNIPRASNPRDVYPGYACARNCPSFNGDKTLTRQLYKDDKFFSIKIQIMSTYSVLNR